MSPESRDGARDFRRKDIVSREAKDGFGLEGAGELASTDDCGMKGFGCFVVGDDDDARGLSGTNEKGKVEGAGGKGESRDTSTPRASAEVAAYTLKSFRMLQVGEELADERKNHAGLTLAAWADRQAGYRSNSEAACSRGSILLPEREHSVFMSRSGLVAH